ncbi:STAS domain-containing protein [Pseudonocardia sp.]|uniref:STAS domain-containing protein n=1 Tax=Pseudonocardia sp. TaxID=60912 RepID=UPI00261FE42F|nr:STAS domain-containing protein [Pseudonocardia sp.]
MSDTMSPVDDEGPSPSMLDTTFSHPAPGVVLLAAAGEIDTLTAPRLDAALARLVDEAASTLVVDLTQVVFLASSGLAVLIEAAHRASGSGRALRLLVQGRPVLRALQITGTDQLFELHTDREAALLPDPEDRSAPHD